MKTPCLLLLTALASPGLSLHAVDFVKDVQPILETNCVRCHNPKGTDFEKGDTDLNLSTKEGAFEAKSTIVPGDAAKSKLYTTTVLPDDAKKLMPPRNKVTSELERLSKEETETLKNWINEGAKWPEGVTLTARKKEVGGKTAADEAVLVVNIAKRIATQSPVVEAKAMLAYTAPIPGSEVSFDMVPIPGGKFKMGSPETEKGRDLTASTPEKLAAAKKKLGWPEGMKSDEGPVHEVEIAPFWMGKLEITWN